ncbi:hypothetical protein D3C76_1391140 [compost metagenome]
MGKTAGDGPNDPSTTCRPADDHCHLRGHYRSLGPCDTAVSQRVQPNALHLVSCGLPVLSDCTVFPDTQFQLQVVLQPVTRQNVVRQYAAYKHRGHPCHGQRCPRRGAGRACHVHVFRPRRQPHDGAASPLCTCPPPPAGANLALLQPGQMPMCATVDQCT